MPWYTPMGIMVTVCVPRVTSSAWGPWCGSDALCFVSGPVKGKLVQQPCMCDAAIAVRQVQQQRGGVLPAVWVGAVVMAWPASLHAW